MRHFDSLLALLHVLTVTFFILTIYSILQSNSTLLSEEFRRFVSFKLLDTGTAASLFVTLLGALVVRHQFVLGYRPRISYRSSFIERQGEIWQVTIRNVGLGPAILNRIYFNLGSLKQKHPSSQNFDDVVKELKIIGLHHQVDYWLSNISDGFTLSPKEDYALFEIKKEHLPKINFFNATVSFQGMLGDKYNREIAFIPKRLQLDSVESSSS